VEWAGGAYDIHRVSAAMAARDLGIATGVLAASLGTDPISVGGTPEQEAFWMRRIADEALLVAYGAAEPRRAAISAGWRRARRSGQP
jgi:alkylation response protein AidB-like acyl-CoA dehydrogenase